MRIPLRWQQLLVAELIVLIICFFAVNLLVDFLDFSSHPAAKTPTPYFPHVYEDAAPDSHVAIKKGWPQLLFIFLVFCGQMAIFRWRKLIFKTNQRKNG